MLVEGRDEEEEDPREEVTAEDTTVEVTMAGEAPPVEEVLPGPVDITPVEEVVARVHPAATP